MQNMQDMSKNQKKNKINSPEGLRGFLLALLGGILLAVALFLIFGRHHALKHGIVDSLFVSGVILSAAGLFSFVKTEGFFDLIQFGAKQMKDMTFRAMKGDIDSPLDSDYIGFKQRKRAIRRTKWGVTFAGILIVIAAILVNIF